jgi:hypothetical protein
MIKAFQIIFSPSGTWQKISESERGVPWIFLFYLLPWTALGVAAEGFGLVKWGERVGEFGHLLKISEDLAIRYSAVEGVLLLASVIVGAQFLSMIVSSFNVLTDYRRCFTVLAYGFSPIILSRVPDAAPMLPTWACWGVGVVLASSILYHGVGVILKPDQTKGFGLFIVSSLIAAASSAIAHILAIAVLRGKLLH